MILVETSYSCGITHIWSTSEQTTFVIKVHGDEEPCGPVRRMAHCCVLYLFFVLAFEGFAKIKKYNIIRFMVSNKVTLDFHNVCNP